MLSNSYMINNSGISAISSINCQCTTKISKYYIQLLTKKIKSYIRNITDFLKRNKIKTIPQNTILIMNVTSP